jgi:glutamate-1-semialdehyde aminotransferase
MVINKNKNPGIKLYNKAKKIIPSGTMLYSKKAELHSPDHWPSYYKKSKGCNVWGLDNKKYIDMMFAVGTNTLGYCNQTIDKKIINTINKGNMTSLNNNDEVKLAQVLVKIHPWSEQVRFFRGGGEANSAAIRVARASTRKKNIAFCGYHGWHDWYLSSNHNNKENLNSHLMTNLKSYGVPIELKNSCHPFFYNDLNNLKKIIKKKKIGIIIMEVRRNIIPKNNFLQKVRSLCNKNKIILIFDECTSGFRENLGGLHLTYKVNPDLAMFGKAMGNGYAINAIIGKKKYMKNFDKTFVSSTFWTERIGSAAALSTIDYMKRNKTYLYLKKQGKKIKSEWEKISKETNVEIEVSSLDTIPIFTFKSLHNLKKTYFTQEMLKKRFIASNIVYVSICHNNKILKKYFNNFKLIFKKISNLKKSELYNELNGRECFSPFSRLN